MIGKFTIIIFINIDKFYNYKSLFIFSFITFNPTIYNYKMSDFQCREKLNFPFLKTKKLVGTNSIKTLVIIQNLDDISKN